MSELAHVGVKGMKWGVRKNRDGGGSSRSAAPRKPTAGGKSAAKTSVSEAKQSTKLQSGARIAGKTLKLAGKVAVVGLASMPIAMSAAMWQQWGYSPIDLINNEPFMGPASEKL